MKRAITLDRRLIDKAMARLDAKRVRARKAKMSAARDNAKRRDRERRMAKAEALRPSRGRKVAKLGPPGWQVLVARMDDGTWYTFAELRALTPEYAIGSIKAWVHQRLPREGLIEKAGNPDCDPAAKQGSRFLYGLSPAGREQAASARSDIGLVSGTDFD